MSQRKDAQPEETRGLTHDILVGAAAVGANNVLGPVVSKVTEHLLNRPKEPEQPTPQASPDE